MPDRYLYYLVYKLKNSSALWLSDESIHIDDLYRKIYNFISDKENYYIIRKKYSIDYINNILNTKFRGFNTFKLDSNCELIYTTKSKSNNKIAES